MDTFKVIIDRNHQYGMGPEDSVDFIINGRNLALIIQDVEISQKGLPNGYDGIPADMALLPSRLLLNEPGEYANRYDYFKNEGEERKVPVLGCGCGVIDCSPIYVKITIEEDNVKWSDFYNPYETDDYSGVHADYSQLKFEFEKNQYMAELSKGYDLFREKQLKKYTEYYP